MFYYVNSAGKKSFLLCDYHETKSKEEKNKKNAGSKKKAHCRQSVRYRPWWKQGNIKMAVSEDHAEIFFHYDETKSKEEKNKKNESKKKAHCRQSVRYRSWWKQGNIRMAVSEDPASCWVRKDLTVTTKQIQALLTAARASGGKRMSCTTDRYQAGILDGHRDRQIRMLRFPRHSHSS